ncbi:MAG: DUF61 family protein [Candidatus Odinarchaeota archaeon]
MSGYKKPLDYLMKEIALSMRNLPAAKKSLEELVSEPRPFITDRNREIISLPVGEINELASIVPRYYHSQVKLPFIFLSRGDYFEFSGSLVERFVVEGIIDASARGKLQIKGRFFKSTFQSKYPYFYAYHLQRLRKHFPSLVYIAYSFS